jgi:3-(3-hydroxy-phenyl)propionate hydroxylase
VEAVRSVSASCDVAVVGLGPVGAVLCALLGERGIHVIAIEPDAEPPAFPRAIAADDEMLRTVLQLPGMADPHALFDSGQRVEVRAPSGRRITSVAFDSSRLGVSGLSFFHQPSLERALRAAAQASPSVQVRLGRRVVQLADGPEGIRIGLDDGADVSARWVIGCDGATSTVRRLRGIDYGGRSFREPWLVIDVDSPTPLEHLPCFSYVLDRRRPAVNMPRPGGHRFEFMLMPGEDPGVLASPASVNRLLAPYLAPLRPAVRSGLHIVRATVYAYHSRVASRWRDGRVLLAGDAAHCMPPFGGQGLGAGIGDALTLAWRLDEVVRGLAPPGVLDGYEKERRPRVAEMNRTALIAGRLLTAHTRSGAAAVKAALRLIDATPWLGAQFRAGALRAKPSVPVPPAERRAGGGRPVPSPLLPSRWVLLGRGVDPWTLVSTTTAAALRARDGVGLAVAATDTLAALWTNAGPDSVALVRPDGFVAAVGAGAVITDVLTRLTR